MDPLVSVYCLAYNHGKYIRDALEGFVCQKTSFPYEVIVHDDASTDNTGKIIKEYADKYPDIIKPILQKENQYSKGVGITKTFIFPLVKGKYIAACEGDDYWCDENKLQLQVDWLEKHQEYSFCVHNTLLHNCMDGNEKLVNPSKQDRDISIDEIILWKGNLFHTSSYMYRSEYMNTPSEFAIKGIGDYPKSVYLAVCGKVRFLSNVMSVYRFQTSESWSIRNLYSADSTTKMINHWQQRIKMLQNVNTYTKRQYESTIQEAIRRNEFNIYLYSNELKTLKRDYSEYYKTLEFKEKMRMHIKYYCPFIYKIRRAFHI